MLALETRIHLKHASNPAEKLTRNHIEFVCLAIFFVLIAVLFGATFILMSFHLTPWA